MARKRDEHPRRREVLHVPAFPASKRGDTASKTAPHAKGWRALLRVRELVTFAQYGEPAHTIAFLNINVKIKRTYDFATFHTRVASPQHTCSSMAVAPALSSRYLGAIEAVELQHEDRDSLADGLDHHQEANQSHPHAPAQLQRQKIKNKTRQKREARRTLVGASIWLYDRKRVCGR